MRVTIEPEFIHEAEVRVPSSKSLSHRALIAAALAEGTSVLKGINMSQDIEATMKAMESFGASFEEENGTVTVHGNNALLQSGERIIDCNESGSTLRFLIPAAALSQNETIFKGRGRLMQRPQSVYEKIFQEQNLFFEQNETEIRIRGPLKAGVYEVDGNVSSQFISGLLFALPLLDGDSEIIVKPPFESSAYVTLTLDALAKAGIQVRRDGLRFEIKGGQSYRPVDLTVDGDDSQAAFFAALSLIHKIPVTVKGMAHDSSQPDHVIVHLIHNFGGSVRVIEDGYGFGPGSMKPIEADLSGCPDLGPVLFALAALIPETSVFTNCGRLRIKESDRIESMKKELEKLGASVRAEGDTVYVHGPLQAKEGTVLEGHNDHRIVMALSVLAAAGQTPFVIEGAEAIAKSYPGFFEDLAKCGMKVTYD